MTEYSKFNIVYRLQKWLDSVPGQTFLNYAYSWGAAVVILGALFKLIGYLIKNPRPQKKAPTKSHKVGTSK